VNSTSSEVAITHVGSELYSLHLKDVARLLSVHVLVGNPCVVPQYILPN